jgi:predicted tellurium resistance membrane protein TerC
MGLMAAAAIRDPARNRIVIYGLAALLVMRVAQRFIYADLITSAFGISPTQLYVQSGFFLALAIALVLLRPKTTPA